MIIITIIIRVATMMPGVLAGLGALAAATAGLGALRTIPDLSQKIIHTYVHVYIYIYIIVCNMHTYYIYRDVHIHTHTYIHVYIYIYIYIYIYGCHILNWFVVMFYADLSELFSSSEAVYIYI